MVTAAMGLVIVGETSGSRWGWHRKLPAGV